MHFACQFRTATGLRPHEFLLRRRIQRAEELLRNTTMPIVEIALTIGFQTQAHLTRVFKRFAWCTPGRWRAINQMPIAPQPGRSKRAELMNAEASQQGLRALMLTTSGVQCLLFLAAGVRKPPREVGRKWRG
jgi:AraC-like DNA-binding protein